MKKVKIIWFAVQPTSYNYSLYSALKNSEQLLINFIYEFKKLKDLPYSENFFDVEDTFINEKYFIDLNSLKKLLKPENFIVFAGWNNNTKLIALLIRAFFKLPYAIWTDSVDPEKYKKRSFINLIKSFVCKRATIMYTTGDFGIKNILKSNLLKSQDNLYSLPYFTQLPKIDHSFYLKNGTTFNIVLLSRLVEYKGIDDAIKSMFLLKENKNIFLHIGGVGPLENELKDLAKELGVTQQIIFLGWLNQDQKVKVLLNSDILIHPIKGHEPFGLVIIEALSYGLPVISCNNAGAAYDRIIDGKNGFLIPNNSPHILAEKIKYLFENKNDLNIMSKNARKTAEEWPIERGVKIIEDSINGYYGRNG